ERRQLDYQRNVIDTCLTKRFAFVEPQLRIGYENIRAYNTENGQFTDQDELLSGRQKIWNRNFFCYSIMKVSPLAVQSALYQGGQYFSTQSTGSMLRHTQFISGCSVSSGMNEGFMNAYSVLCALPEMTVVSDENRDTYLALNNETTHDVMLLQEPEYAPALYVDNSDYDATHEDRFTSGGRRILADTPFRMESYQCNMAALLQLGNWFDFLREQGVYDNTRVIIVADHGFAMNQFEDLLFGDRAQDKNLHHSEDVMAYNPLFLVKDFESTGFHVDDRFMTNADTPVLALDGLVNSPINPFTGKAITDEPKDAEEYHIFNTSFNSPKDNDGNTFRPGNWYALRGQNIFDTSAWRSLGYY
ncbi:MAG: hypothetical protein IKO13_02860, partial [Oscillospiraceae bacterium]|nr:hypothetical protein [Oscillospiraceae bacterium]